MGDIEVGARRAGPGEAEAFERLYREWWDDLVTLCRRLLGRGVDAEDAAQEAFVRAWLAHDRYSATKPYWPWLATIARRLCIDLQRVQHGRARDEEVDVDADAVVITPERIVLATEDLQLVFEAFDGLRERDRHALALRTLDGRSYDEIARLQQVSVEAVRGSLKRARATVRRSVLHGDVFPEALHL